MATSARLRRAMLDRLILAFACLIAALIVTGGARFGVGAARLELSQVDAFAWVLLALLAARRLRRGEWLPPALARLARSGASALERHPLPILAGGVTFYAVLHVWISAWRFDSFHANAWDLGFVDQALWCTARGGGFLHSDMAKGGTYLGEHFSPALAVGAAAYAFTDSVRGLFAFQTLVLASGAPLAYALARARGASRGASTLAGLCLLAYRPLRAANVFDFREDDLLVPVFFALLLALETRRRALFWVLALASWTVKELAPLYTALLGAWLAFRPSSPPRPGPGGAATRRGPGRSDGVVLLAGSAVAFYVLVAIVTPHLSGGGGETVLARRLGGLGHTNAEILGAALTHPGVFWGAIGSRIVSLGALRYLAEVGVPFAAFVPSALPAALVALAGALFNIAFVLHGVGFHYECAMIPFLFYVLASGLSGSGPAGSPAASPSPPPDLAPTRLALVVVGFLLFFGRGPLDTLRSMVPKPHHRQVAAALAAIPRDAVAATHAALFPHVTHRARAALLPHGLGQADWVAVDRSPDLSRYDTPDLIVITDSLAVSGATRVVERGPFTLWRRARAADAGPVR